MVPMAEGAITVVLADDNLIVRSGVRALLSREDDVEVVGEAADKAELLAAADALHPQVVVSDIRMPPTFQREGIDAAKEIRQRHPGTGVVILSQYDDPEYAVSLLADGAAGYSYLLKDRLAEGDQLIDAIRAVATGGTMLDPVIVDALVRPVTPTDGALTPAEQELLTAIAEGKPIKAIAVGLRTTPRRCPTPSRPCSSAWPRARRPATRGHSAGCGCSTRRSSIARSRVRPCRGCSPGAWPRSCGSKVATSGSPRTWR